MEQNMLNCPFVAHLYNNIADISLKGTVIPTGSGYYKPSLKKINGEWKITTHRIYHDLTFAFPGK
ncbi:hypothetical protein A3860_23030 [Niastella vici]|uniref:SnoaL-like domain-containing protein n=1 Tax=Niastella vici TaxID=1703345 RepID=A0A1V9FZL3_9BACT|nr:hypothetical protein A3860_23030 [Niastella vici]